MDTVNRTPVQLDYWRINFQPVPEAALNPSLHLEWVTDTLDQFSPLSLSVAVENLTPWDMDSLLTNYVINDAINGQHSFSERYAPLPGNQSYNIDYTFNTDCDCYAGLNYLFIEINPNNDQPEQHHFNNYGLLEFNVFADDVNPILDVTFDGVHILDGDIVSAKPVIDISLNDESELNALNDSSLLDIYFIYPDGSQQSVVFDGIENIWYPVEDGQAAVDNTARATLNPVFDQDGIYTLVVQGYDRSGNASGDNAYRISFEVINKPMISNVLNYPNPFTTATRFVFTLTGSEVPQFMKIQIMTITGKVVREVLLPEMGNVHVGNNITEFVWDGTDQYGDRLANGLYLYRIAAVLDGQNLEHFDTGTDQYFKNGIGKMYLMR
jgi:hypothetical protein